MNNYIREVEVNSSKLGRLGGWWETSLESCREEVWMFGLVAAAAT